MSMKNNDDAPDELSALLARIKLIQQEKALALPPPPKSARGPDGRRFSEADGVSFAKDDPAERPKFKVLDQIMVRMHKPSAFADTTVCLEITQGPYRGIVFFFKTFEMQPVVLDNGLVPTRYETEILFLPDRFPADWQPDEGFDDFTKEVLFAWMAYIQVNSLAPLIRAETDGQIH